MIPKSHFFRQTCQTCLQSMLSMGQSEAAGPTVLLQQAEKLWAKHNLHVLRLPKSRGYHGVPQIIQDHPVVMDDHKIVLKQFETYWNPWWRLGIHHFKKPPHLDSSRQAASLWKYLLRWQRPCHVPNVAEAPHPITCVDGWGAETYFGWDRGRSP